MNLFPNNNLSDVSREKGYSNKTLMPLYELLAYTYFSVIKEHSFFHAVICLILNYPSEMDHMNHALKVLIFLPLLLKSLEQAITLSDGRSYRQLGLEEMHA